MFFVLRDTVGKRGQNNNKKKQTNKKNPQKQCQGVKDGNIVLKGEFQINHLHMHTSLRILNSTAGSHSDLFLDLQRAV